MTCIFYDFSCIGDPNTNLQNSSGDPDKIFVTHTQNLPSRRARAYRQVVFDHEFFIYFKIRWALYRVSPVQYEDLS
jgi:hypothetical protein